MYNVHTDTAAKENVCVTVDGRETAVTKVASITGSTDCSGCLCKLNGYIYPQLSVNLRAWMEAFVCSLGSVLAHMVGVGGNVSNVR